MLTFYDAPDAARAGRWFHPVVLFGLAWLVIVAQLLADHWSETATTLSDMDDAMRLVEMRPISRAAAG